MMVFFSFFFFVSGVGLAYVAYSETTRRPREAAAAHYHRIKLSASRLEERVELCEHCCGDKVVAVGQRLTALSFEECPRCSGRGYVDVIRQASGCSCDLCVGDK